MDAFIQLVIKTISQVVLTLSHNWPFLILSTLVAVGLKLYVDQRKVSAFLIRHRKAGVIGATAAAVGTPLCSCGTTAVILGMMASMLPWAPIIAFMVSSPLTSPEELIYSAGLFGWPFALAFFAASIILGLTGGLVGGFFEARGWLRNQTRLAAPVHANTLPAVAPLESCACERSERALVHESVGLREFSLSFQQPVLAQAACGCDAGVISSQTTCCQPAAASSACSQSACSQSAPELCACGAVTVESESRACDCGSTPVEPQKARVTPRMFLEETFTTGKRLLLMFLGFAFIGYFLNGLIPAAWVAAVFGQGSVYSVPLAATLGLPLYINTEASLPLVRALIDGGMSQGAALAFLITGAGTSIGAIAGALTIARWRVIALVIGTLWVGAVVLGYLYNALLMTGLV